MTDKNMSDLLDRVGSLPSVAARIIAMTSDPACALAPLAEVIGCDPAMTLRFMALANCASVYRGHSTRTLRDALVRLGLRRTRDVALLMGMHDLVPSRETIAGIDPLAFWKYTLATAATAQCLAERLSSVEEADAWLVGLLHGIGLPILAQKAPAAFQRARQLMQDKGLTLRGAETEVLGFHHGHIASQLMLQWQLPPELAAAVGAGPDSPGEETTPLGNVLEHARRFVASLGYGNQGPSGMVPATGASASPLETYGWDSCSLASEVGRQVNELSTLIEIDLTGGALDATLAMARHMATRIGLEGINDSLARQEMEDTSRKTREIQRQLLPKTDPTWPGYSVATVNLPGQDISGDTYDFPTTSPGFAALMIADVVGKGMPAALLAGNLQASVRALAPHIADPSLLLATLNQTLLETTSDEIFATMILATLDIQSGRVRLASAGHPHALIIDNSGPRICIPQPSPPLGILPGATFEPVEFTLHPGESLILHTDGISEALDAQQNEFGRSGIAAALKTARDGSPKSLLNSLIKAVVSHGAAPASPQRTAWPLQTHDDMTVIILQRQGGRGI